MKPIAMHTLATTVTKDEVLTYFRSRGHVVKNRIGMSEDWAWNAEEGHVKVKRYFLEHAIGFYDNDDGRFRRAFCISDNHRYKPDDWHWSLYDMYLNNTIQIGLLTGRSNNGRQYDRSDTVADSIWYDMHGIECFYKDGRIKRGFGNHIARRLGGFCSSSRTTTIMLSIARNALDMNDDLSNPTQAICDRFGIPNRGFFQHDHFNNHVVLMKEKLKRVCLSGKQVWTQKSTDPTDHGYVIDEQRDSRYRDNHTYYFKLPNEVYVDEEYVDRDSVNMIECQQCDRKHIEEYMIPSHGGHLCLDCAPRDYSIHNYSANVEDQLEFKATKVKDNPLYFGIELEYESAQKMRKTRIYTGNKLRNHALMKHDGSLRDGVEIVSCPAEFDIHKPIYKSFLDDLPDNITVSSRTGMHVHVSRKALSPLQEARIIDFMNRSDNQNFIRKIAMRQSNNYQRAHDHTFRHALRSRKAFNVGESLYYPKYANLNIGKLNTIEFRVFSTPRTYKEFSIKLEFVKALVDYCQLAWYNVGIKSQTYYTNFMDWLSNQRKSYADLYNFCKEKSLCV